MPLSCLVSFHDVAVAAGWSAGEPARDVVALDLPPPRRRRPVDKSFLDDRQGVLTPTKESWSPSWTPWLQWLLCQ